MEKWKPKITRIGDRFKCALCDEDFETVTGAISHAKSQLHGDGKFKDRTVELRSLNKIFEWIKTGIPSPSIPREPIFEEHHVNEDTYICPCGSYLKDDSQVKKHNKTKKHKAFLQSEADRVLSEDLVSKTP